MKSARRSRFGCLVCLNVAVMMSWSALVLADQTYQTAADVNRAFEAVGGKVPSKEQKVKQIELCKKIMGSDTTPASIKESVKVKFAVLVIPAMAEDQGTSATTLVHADQGTSTSLSAMRQGPVAAPATASDDLRAAIAYLEAYLNSAACKSTPELSLALYPVLVRGYTKSGQIDLAQQELDKRSKEIGISRGGSTWFAAQRDLLRAEGRTDSEIDAWFEARASTTQDNDLKKAISDATRGRVPPPVGSK